MRRPTILTLPWGGHDHIDTRGWCVLHRRRPSAAELLARIGQERATKLLTRWSGEMGPVYLAHWTDQLRDVLA